MIKRAFLSPPSLWKAKHYSFCKMLKTTINTDGFHLLPIFTLVKLSSLAKWQNEWWNLVAMLEKQKTNLSAYSPRKSGLQLWIILPGTLEILNETIYILTKKHCEYTWSQSSNTLIHHPIEMQGAWDWHPLGVAI